MKFRAELQQDGKTATGITVPPEVLDALGGGRRPAVAVTINGHTYRSTIGSMGGVAKIPVSSAVRAAAGVTARDTLDVEVVLDNTPREVSVPDDLAAALTGNAGAREFFAQLSYSRQLAYVSWVEQAKKPDTRASRVTQTAALLADKRPQR
jgi:Bacteriocin-protection, YdeI or OmpD-Associated/Domain of unknown function (DUF1905)